MQYDLVFQGGGAKGMAFVGAMRAFEAREHTFRRLVGTSAGAINAALLAAGYNADDMAEALNETDDNQRPIFESFMKAYSLKDIDHITVDDSLIRKLIGLLREALTGKDDTESAWLEQINQLHKLDPSDALQFILPMLSYLGLVDPSWTQWLQAHAGSIYALIETGGFFSAEHFVTWLEKKLNEKDKRYGGATLSAFYKMTGHDLSLCVTDVTSAKLLVLNHRTAPDLPLIWAVRMSMSIPFVWPPVSWLSTWGTYREGDIESVLTDHLIIDGGALSNFAIRLTTSSGPAVKAVMANDAQISDVEFARFNAQAPTLGFMLDATIDVPNLAPLNDTGSIWSRVGDWWHENAPRTNGISLLLNSLNTLMVGNDNFVIASQEDVICRLPVGGIGTLEFDMSPERKQALVTAAQLTTEAFFKGSVEFVVNDLFMAVGETGQFQIGCSINGTPNSKDWIGLFKSPHADENDIANGNWRRVQPGENILDTVTEANIGEYEARYYTTDTAGWLTTSYRLLKRTGPLNRVTAK